MTEQNNELADLVREMGEDPAKDTETVKQVSRASKKKYSSRKSRKKKEPEVQPEPEKKDEALEQDSNGNYSAVFEAEPVFDDQPKHDTSLNFILGDDMVKVTEEDKNLYLKAILNDVPLKLTITFANGISVTCRALTPYERNLVPYAVAHHFKELGGTDHLGTAFLTDYARQYMMAMQVVSIGNKMIDYLKYDSTQGSQADHVAHLAKEGKLLTDNYSIAKYNLLIKALNVFENKLARLNTAALKQDFWDPADAG